MSDENMDTQSENLSEETNHEAESTWENNMEELGDQMSQSVEDQQVATNDQVEPAAENWAASDSNNRTGQDAPNLRFVLDVPLQITVELGRKRLLVQELLQLNQGSIIQLGKQVGEPFAVLANQKLIARGEVVVVNDKFGVRITDIISPSDRMQQLQ